MNASVTPLLSVHSHVAASLKDGVPSLARVAVLLGTTPRTLQRALARAGTTYQEIVDEERRVLALALVRNSSTPMLGVARAIGFRNASAFSRAFRKWFGVSGRTLRLQSRDA